MTLPIFILFSLKDLTFIIRIARFGVFAIFLYGVFLIYKFIENLVSGGIKENSDKLRLFASNIWELAGVIGNLALAFFVHNFIVSIT